MADPPHYPDATDDVHRTPRWVKVFGTIALLVVLLLLLLLLIRDPSGHGPQRHLSSAEASGQAPLSGAAPHTVAKLGPG